MYLKSLTIAIENVIHTFDVIWVWVKWSSYCLSSTVFLLCGYIFITLVDEKSWGFSYKYLLLLHWQGSVSHYHWIQRILWNMDLWLLDYVGLEVISLKHGNISDFSFVKKMFLSIKLSLETECSGSLLSRFPRISRVRPSRKQWPKNAEHGQGAE